DIYTVTVAGSITRDGAVAAVAQVAADADTGTVSTVTAHGGVVQGAVTADVHTIAVAGGITRDVTSCHRTINVNTRSVTGGI
ncbi:hypothetical protein ACKWPY_25445, partial [Escherichia coli]|uniref:hypothetical protein n=1 Tax=Escherichia coli TaxID=562 RepID=UPI0039049591